MTLNFTSKTRNWFLSIFLILFGALPMQLISQARPEIAISKSSCDAGYLPNGNYQKGYTIILKNVGNEIVDSINIEDDFFRTFTASATGGSAVGSYFGGGNNMNSTGGSPGTATNGTFSTSDIVTTGYGFGGNSTGLTTGQRHNPLTDANPSYTGMGPTVSAIQLLKPGRSGGSYNRRLYPGEYLVFTFCIEIKQDHLADFALFTNRAQRAFARGVTSKLPALVDTINGPRLNPLGLSPAPGGWQYAGAGNLAGYNGQYPEAGYAVTDTFYRTRSPLRAGIRVGNLKQGPGDRDPIVNLDGKWDYYYVYKIKNIGLDAGNNLAGRTASFAATTPGSATNVQMIEDYGMLYSASPTLPVNSVVVTQIAGPAGAANLSFNGNTNKNLLSNGVTLAPEDSIIIRVDLNVGPSLNLNYFSNIIHKISRNRPRW